MSESKNTLQNAASWAAIIACFIAVLSYFGINPFNEKESDTKDSISLNVNNVSNNDSYINENNFDKTNKESKIITLETAEEMTWGEILLIPFKKHEKACYLNVIQNKNIVVMIIIELILGIILTLLFYLNLSFILEITMEKIYEKKERIYAIGIDIILLFFLYYLICLMGGA